MPAIKSMERPRPLILGLLVVTAVLAAIWAVWPAASQPPAPSNQREARKPATQGTTGRTGGPGSTPLPGDLDVRLEALKQSPAEPDAAARNPFRFYVPPPPPTPPPPKPVAPPPPVHVLAPGDAGYVAPPPPPPPPIPLKFIGTLEQGGRKVAIFSDGRGLPLYGKEGELILGQYKIVRIGVESVVMEYANGKGRQTIPMRG
jgi:hypothetical protein